MADDESRGVHLSDKQLVFVFMAGTVAAVVVFLFGVLVGRGAQGARGPIAGAEMTAAATQVVPDGAPGDPSAAGDVPREGSGGVVPDEFSYPARLGKTPPAEQLKQVPPAGDAAREMAPPDIPEEPVAQAPAAAGPAATFAAASAAAFYTVQVAAVTRRDEADANVKRLKAKGYDAYVVVPDRGDGVGVFRVRIGSFKDKRKAEMLAERLAREDKRYKPWVTLY